MRAAAAIRTAAATMAAAALIAPPAFAHGAPGLSKLYLSTVERITPSVRGLKIVVLGRDDRLQLTNETGKLVTVPGYQGEPYLQFRPDGVWQNLNSPATYLNNDRLARVIVPTAASASAKPSWQWIQIGHVWAWHDHRIHWMSTTLPPIAQQHPNSRQKVFDWTVPLFVGTEAVSIQGRLDYVPAQSSGAVPTILVAAAIAAASAIVISALALLYVRRRHQARQLGRSNDGGPRQS